MTALVQVKITRRVKADDSGPVNRAIHNIVANGRVKALSYDKTCLTVRNVASRGKKETRIHMNVMMKVGPLKFNVKGK